MAGSKNVKTTKRILILGITSIIGYRFYKLNNHFEVFGLCRNWHEKTDKNIFQISDLDDKTLKSKIMIIKPDVIINCIGLGNLDECEKKPLIAQKINQDFPIRVLNICLNLLFFYSYQF